MNICITPYQVLLNIPVILRTKFYLNATVMNGDALRKMGGSRVISSYIYVVEVSCHVLPQIFGFLPLPCSLCVCWNFRYRCGVDVCPGRHAPFQILPGDTLPNEMHDQLFNPHMTCGYLLLTTFKWRLIQRGSNTVTNKKQLQENRHTNAHRDG